MWTTVNQQLRFTYLELQASFHVASPSGGLFDLRVDDQPLSGMTILQCHNAGAAAEPEDFLVEHYVREDDLVVTYTQSPVRANRKQIYVRRAGFLYGEPLMGAEIVFSMQTQRLDGDPSLLLRGEWETSRMHALVDPESPRWETVELPEDACDMPKDHYCGCFAAEIAGAGLTYVQVLDPADFIGGRIIKLSEDSERYALSLPVFGASLEKGVIRRGRMTGFFLRSSDGLESASRFYDWYRNSSPPLTT